MSTQTSGTTSRIGATGADRAYFLLRTVFIIAPIAFGLDKFFDLMTQWEGYLAPWIDNIVPGDAHTAMVIVGVIEIVAGIVVAVIPRYGALLVAVWLGGIIINLLSMGSFFDVALRDFGLMVAALALAALAFDRAKQSASSSP